MRHALLWGVLAFGLAGVGSAPVAVLHASTYPGAGTAIKIDAVEDAGATVWDWLTKGIGVTIGVVLGTGGMAKMAGRESGKGLMMVGAGVGTALVPYGISGAYKAAPAATLLETPAALMPTWPVLETGLLAVNRFLFDPTVLFFVTVALLLCALRTPQRTSHVA